MELIQVTVESYSGYKADEYPKSFYLDEIKFEITDITDRWYQAETKPSGPASDYFRITTDGGAQYLLKHILKADKWYLCL